MPIVHLQLSKRKIKDLFTFLGAEADPWRGGGGGVSGVWRPPKALEGV